MFNRLMFIFVLSFILLIMSPHEGMARTVVMKAQGLPMRENATYSLTWLGVTLGKATLYWQENAERYRMGFELTSDGLAEMFSDQHLATVVVGLRSQEGEWVRYSPLNYTYWKKTPEEINEVRIRYDERGRIAQLSVAPPDNPAYRPMVSQSGRDAAYDPMTALLALVAGEPEFTLYDGRRLMTTLLRSVPPTTEEAAAGWSGLSLTRRPIEGYTVKELKRMKDDRPLRLVMRTGTSRFPELLQLDTAIGGLRATRLYTKPKP